MSAGGPELATSEPARDASDPAPTTPRVSAVAVLRSRALVGMEAPPVTVEVHLASGLPSFALVGLPEAEVREARERVRAAIVNCGFEFPARRITVNLAPAELPKESGRFDLPIALGILAASGQLRRDALDRYEFAGELALTGELRPVRGALAMTWFAARDGRAFVLPAASAREAALVKGARVHAAPTLLSVCAHLMGVLPLEVFQPASAPLPALALDAGSSPAVADLADVAGQQQAKRALEVAAAGGHSLLLVGSPGTGKTMLASRLPGILPPMTDSEAIEAAAMQSISNRGFDPRHWRQRPFRAPHHSASAVALVGGGSLPRPGEISLAQHGVLFLDELPEFDRRVLEALREPLESGRITVSRAARQADFPAQFQLVAAMNPCPCGYLGHPSGRCQCTPDQIARYRRRVSGPLLDRIDLALEVPPVTEHDLVRGAPAEASALVRARVCIARERQLVRQGRPNALLEAGQIDRHCALDDGGLRLMQSALDRLWLSARAFQRIRKVARTVADLAGAQAIEAVHVAEAIQFRRFNGGA